MLPHQSSDGGWCYDRDQIHEIASGLKELDVCKTVLDERGKLLDKLQQHSAPTLWWQEPEAIIGGMALSFAFGVVLGPHLPLILMLAPG